MSFSDLLNITRIDKLGVEERVSRFCKRSIKNTAKSYGLHLALSMIDLTTLEGKDTYDKVKRLCYKARHLEDSLAGIPNVAAVCVYPNFVRIAKKELQDSGINVASVSTAFPSGNASLEVKISSSLSFIFLILFSRIFDFKYSFKRPYLDNFLKKFISSILIFINNLLV